MTKRPDVSQGNEVAETFGERLRLALSARGMHKQMALAAELDVDASAISRWCNNGRISLYNVVRLCLALELSLDWLVLGRGEPDLLPVSQASGDLLRLVARLRAAPPTVHAALSDLIAAFDEAPQEPFTPDGE